MSHQARLFHTDGPKHDHDHDHDDGKESHSDFQPKQKKPVVDEAALNAQFSEWVQSNDVVLFMKGSKKMPRCGFSNYVVQVLKFYGINNYKDVDILSDEQMREAVKKWSNWPTFP